MAIKVGGTEVVSNARALSNITSIDATTAAAIGAGGIGGGGEVDFTASGAISNGDLVKLNVDGTVSVIQGGGLGSEAVFDSTTVQYTSATFDSNSNKVVVAYKDLDNSNYGTAVVGTISGTSISFGTPTVFESSSMSYTSATFDSNSNKVVIAYRDDGNLGYGTAVVGTVSGTSISFGTPVVFESASSYYTSATFDSNSNKVVIAYRDEGSSNYGTAVVGTVSGTSISFGTAGVFNFNLTEYIAITFDTNSNKVVVAFGDGASALGKAVVGTVSGTSISFGSVATFESATIDGTSATFDSNSNKVVIIYRDRGNSDYGTAVVGTVSGTSISFGIPVVYESAAADNMKVTFDSDSNKVVVAYRDEGSTNTAAIIIGTVSGTSISFGTSETFNTALVNNTGITFDTNANKTVFTYRDTGNSNYGTAITFGVTDVPNWVGFASADVSDGNTATINVVSSVNEGQTGLTIGSKYYLSDSGTLTTTITSGREVGRAIAADKILITQGSVS